MPRPLPGGGILLHGRRRHHPLPQDQDQQLLLFRTWNAVIQFSARHLFCPAHAQTASVSAATAAHVARAGARAGAVLRVEARTQPCVRTTAPRRTLSTAAAAIAFDPPLCTPSGPNDHQQRVAQFRQDTKLAPPSTTDAPSSHYIPAASTPATGTAIPANKGDASSPSAVDQATATISMTPFIERKEERKYHSKTTSWRFPTPASTTQDSVRLWPSTSKALSKVYGALGQIKSHASTSPSSSTILRSTLVYYNYLSRLQATYDTVLISRRDTRTLFLLQGRECKTPENLEQLLRIAMDLIWLNEKERQKNRQRARSPPFRNLQDPSSGITHVHSPADDFHGLRVSEYTIVMNWIGSVNRAVRSGKSLESPLSPHDRPHLFDLRHNSHHTSKPGGSTDQAWAIWQDFLLTGMKPDVVLYTSLMDMLLKAKNFDRADQIWQHMHRTDLETSTRGGVSSPTATSSIAPTTPAAAANGIIDPVFKSLNLDATTGQSSTPSAPASTRRKPHFLHNLDKDSRHRHQKAHSQDGTSVSNTSITVVPNLQTFSVLIQSYAVNRDLKAIVQIYKEIQHQSTDGRGSVAGQQFQQRRTNTVLLNQILSVLIDLGETSAAREIYADMRPSSSHLPSHPTPIDGDYTTENATTTGPPTAASASTEVLSTRWPLHHLNYQRRAVWERETRERSLARLARPSYPPRPDVTTHRLMLQLAKQEGDVELEERVLEELYRQ